MTRINLLPWRETLRKERLRQFISIAISAAVLMCFIIFYIHMHISTKINAQKVRNDYLQSEISKVDKKIKEIKTLETKKKNLLARMNVIQDLQGKRPEIVHLFFELMSNVPSGVYLTSVVQKDSLIMIEGIAQSNTRISAFMRKLEATSWLENPRLSIITTQRKVGQVRTSTFKLQVKQTQPKITGEGI